MRGMGLLLMGAGALLLAAGLVIWLMERGGLGWRVPGDLSWSGPGWRVSLPLGTGILISLVLTAVLNLVLAWFRRS